MPLLRSSDSSGRFSTKIVKLISTFDSTDWLLGVMNSMLLEALHVYLLKYGPRRANTVREEHLVQKHVMKASKCVLLGKEFSS